jgi:hypothetical protein
MTTTRIIKCGDGYYVERVSYFGFTTWLDNDPRDLFWWRGWEFAKHQARFETAEYAEAMWRKYVADERAGCQVVKELK